MRRGRRDIEERASLRRPVVVLAGLIAVAAVVLGREQALAIQQTGTLSLTGNVVWAVAVAAVIAADAVLRRVRRRAVPVRDWIHSMTIGLGYVGIAAVVGKVMTFGVYVWVYEHHRLFDISLPLPILWFVYWVVGDFFAYWTHRAEHRVTVLWCSHQVHHSSTDFSSTTAVRNPWTELLYKPLIGLWAPLLGFPPIMWPVMGALSMVIGQLQHTTMIRRLGPLDALLMTPSNHRVHHASNERYLDKNFGGRVTLWDRLFGTFEREADEEPPVFGLTHPVTATGTLGLVAGGFPSLVRDVRRATGTRERLALCVRPPG